MSFLRKQESIFIENLDSCLRGNDVKGDDMNRREFLKGSAAAVGLAGLGTGIGESSWADRPKPYNLYWGDMHCHCGISYGFGSLEDAFKAAVENRLDFCSVVGHSSWHDTPRDPETFKRIKHYIVDHDEGYARLARLWPDVKRQTKAMLKPGKFVAFLAFEWHSTKYGDRNVYYFEPEGQIVKADSVQQLLDKMKGKKALVIPHHIAYLPGSRGIDWDYFVESEQSPFVEIFSFHGASMSETSPYPNLREMGPRSIEGTVETGLKRGYKFGFIASTDNHGGYPGSFGEGKVACYAGELTQQSLWEAFKSRRVYAVTGDRIIVDFSVASAFMGSELAEPGERQINLSVKGEDFIDYVDLVKNGCVIKRFNPQCNVSPAKSGHVGAKVRFEWGWGRKHELAEWEGQLLLSDGRIKSINPCFRSQALGYDPKRTRDNFVTYLSRIISQSETGCRFHSFTRGNPTPLTPLNNSLLLDVAMPRNASIQANVNGRTFEHTLAELLEGQRSHLVRGYLDVAVSFHRAVPENAFTVNAGYVDSKRENPTDYYYLCVRQKNNQWAWSSPIWVKA